MHTLSKFVQAVLEQKNLMFDTIFPFNSITCFISITRPECRTVCFVWITGWTRDRGVF